MAHPLDDHPLRTLFRAPRSAVRRASSWDRSGGNADFIRIAPGETATLLEEDGAGCINRFYIALAAPELTDYRDGILRCFWDGEATPSVEVPLGDFFGVTHGRIREYSSAFTAVNPGMGASPGLNAYFPMPFGAGARIELHNRADTFLGGLLGMVWFHIEYEVFDGRAARRRTAVPRAIPAGAPDHTGDGAARHAAARRRQRRRRRELRRTRRGGRGQMIGLVLEIENVAGGWYGEGDDMVFIDGDGWPPRIHGTGHEEVFGSGVCVVREYSAQYSGFHLVEHGDYAGFVGAYRWYVADPLRFDESIRWTIEHGHANNFANNYASVAYWYQSEPHAPFPELPARDAMRPPLPAGFDEVRLEVLTGMAKLTGPAENLATIGRFAEPYYRGEFEVALERLRSLNLP